MLRAPRRFFIARKGRRTAVRDCEKRFEASEGGSGLRERFEAAEGGLRLRERFEAAEGGLLQGDVIKRGGSAGVVNGFTGTGDCKDRLLLPQIRFWRQASESRRKS